MKNITLTVPDAVYRAARVRAAEQGTSVSALVTEYLTQLSSHASEFSRLAARQEELVGALGPFRAGDRLSRDEVHERSVR